MTPSNKSLKEKVLDYLNDYKGDLIQLARDDPDFEHQVTDIEETIDEFENVYIIDENNRAF